MFPSIQVWTNHALWLTLMHAVAITDLLATLLHGKTSCIASFVFIAMGADKTDGPAGERRYVEASDAVLDAALF